MLSLTNIEKYYPENERPFGRNILREYLQYKILEIIFNSEIGRSLAFLGGTALRILYGNNRFSEDLDFDNFGLGEEQFTGIADEIKKGLGSQGYKVEIKNVFKGAYRSCIKMPDVLFDNELSDLRQEKIMIQIDTASHDFAYERDLKIINKFDVFTQIYTTPIDVLLSQKIYAALNRSRAKGRDFFDIVFLLPQTKPDYGYLQAKLGIKNGGELKDALISKTADFDFDELAKDVEPFLINVADAKKIKMFIPYIKSLEL
ncbi:MAG: nucleotidyl transferase AbiEii/AbiGii toxin family protein [Candidatus Pacebacteria bacterium]|jgi:predicted nucleotidyltransferase component of viral defense system|nr:nucleotidyl transferase AbiEii/AbiGii toxin family protein [Candidatus Paceibacterota bacterium]